MGNHRIFQNRIIFLWPFSIAMLNYERVTNSHGDSNGMSTKHNLLRMCFF